MMCQEDIKNHQKSGHDGIKNPPIPYYTMSVAASDFQSHMSKVNRLTKTIGDPILI